jgi:hypothetical protein
MGPIMPCKNPLWGFGQDGFSYAWRKPDIRFLENMGPITPGEKQILGFG